MSTEQQTTKQQIITALSRIAGDLKTLQESLPNAIQEACNVRDTYNRAKADAYLETTGSNAEKRKAEVTIKLDDIAIKCHQAEAEVAKLKAKRKILRDRSRTLRFMLSNL